MPIEDPDFPQRHAADLKERFAAGGAEAVLAFVRGFEAPIDRRKLFLLAHQTLGTAECPSLDGYVALMRAAIEDVLAMAAAETDPAERAKRTDFANVLSFNFSAHLAACWPEDARPREERHHREGLAAAERCLAWRRELGKGPGPFALAWWAKGAHELSLGRPSDAAESFERSRESAADALRAAGAEAPPGADFGVVLAEGYRGIALERAGDPSGSRTFDAACAAFERTASRGEGEAKEDAEFGLAQIRCMRERVGAGPSLGSATRGVGG